MYFTPKPQAFWTYKTTCVHICLIFIDKDNSYFHNKAYQTHSSALDNVVSLHSEYAIPASYSFLAGKACVEPNFYGTWPKV